MNHLTSTERSRAIAAMIAAVVLWGSAFVAIRAAVDSYSPGELSFARLFAASLILVVMVVARGGVRVPARRDWLAFVALGTLGQMLYQLLLNTGERSVDAGTASLLIAVAPMLASVLAVWLLGERLSGLGWLGTGVAFTGAAVIAIGSGASLDIGPGVAMVCVAAIVWAVYLVVQKTIAGRYDSLAMTAWPMWIGTLLLTPWAAGAQSAMAGAPVSANFAVAWLAAGSSVGGFLCWAYAIRRVDVVVGSTALYTVPVAAFLIGVVVLHEVPHASALLGGAIAIAGVALAQLKGRPARVDDRVGSASGAALAAEGAVEG